MTQGIVSSLNITLARLNSIENNFNALEGLTNKINPWGVIGSDTSVSADNKDFKTILEEKMTKAREIENIDSKDYKF